MQTRQTSDYNGLPVNSAAYNAALAARKEMMGVFASIAKKQNAKRVVAGGYNGKQGSYAYATTRTERRIINTYNVIQKRHLAERKHQGGPFAVA